MKHTLKIIAVSVAAAGALSTSFLYRGSPTTPGHSNAGTYWAKTTGIYGDGIAADGAKPAFLYRG
jgi:hypothetical protein